MSRSSAGRVRVGIIGAGFGRRVLKPAFERAGAEVVATATRDWRRIVEDPAVEAVAIAVPPAAQPAIALAALQKRKAVFAEKPLATTVVWAQRLLRAARGVTTAVDFELSEIPVWAQAESLLRAGKIGRLRHVSLTWHLETPANRDHVSCWKTRSRDGGGVLFAFASHSFNYLERFCGPLRSIRARMTGARDLPGPQDTLLNFFAEGQNGVVIEGSVCSHAFGVFNHRLVFYGEQGTLLLENRTPDHAKGFVLWLATRADGSFKAVRSPRSKSVAEDGRIEPVSRLALRFLSACRSRRRVVPGFEEGMRVQRLLEACRRSNRSGRAVAV